MEPGAHIWLKLDFIKRQLVPRCLIRWIVAIIHVQISSGVSMCLQAMSFVFYTYNCTLIDNVLNLEKRTKVPPIHSNPPNVTHVATKVDVILRRYAMLTWMHGNRELEKCVIL